MTRNMKFSAAFLRRVCGLIFAVAAICSLAAPGAQASWWNSEWTERSKITLDTSATGAGVADPISSADGTFPVLVRLHSGNFKFDKAKADGSDLRFVAADGSTPLNYHIERFDNLLGEAFVWVAVPDVKPGARSEFYLYYGNTKAAADQDSKASYDKNMALVYHFAERGAAAKDYTQWGNTAQNAGLPAEGAIISGGLRLDGQTAVRLPASASLAWAQNQPVTWSVWFRSGPLVPGAVLFSRRFGENGFVVGLDNGLPFVEVTSNGAVQRRAAASAVTQGSWHHLAVVASAQEITLYVDGADQGRIAGGMPALNSQGVIGGDTIPGPVSFSGEIDELEISNSARSAGFIKATAIGQGPNNAKLIGFSETEENGNWLTGYFAVILRSVTFDGWVIIGILMIMAAISWVVMADKASYLGRVAKANADFTERFRKVAADLTVLDQGVEAIAGGNGAITAAERKMMRNSPLYRVYHIGADELQRRFDGGRPRVLSAQSIEAIRAALDGGLVRESQRLNRQMVLLTIAISGGPFLGLLGTVIGVMITFASIAASGDVNVNAIAPGIAAALVATVAGLVVAIPALFGYNYLLSRIKDQIGDMQVFVDEFTTKMAEYYSGPAGA